MKMTPGTIAAFWPNKNSESKCASTGYLYLTNDGKAKFMLKMFLNAYKEDDGFEFNICLQSKEGLTPIGKLGLNTSGFIDICETRIKVKVKENKFYIKGSERPPYILIPEDYIEEFGKERLSEEQVYVNGMWRWPEEAVD